MHTGERDLTVTFCGVRGVHPCYGPLYAAYGGETVCTHVCLESLGASPIHVIFDSGSGIISLGRSLMQQRPSRIFLFFSHVHLDHILGLPYFAPFWSPDWDIHIFAGQVGGYGKVTTYLKKHIAPPLFPVPLPSFPARISYHYLRVYDTVEMDGFEMQTFPLNHPGGALGYRLNYKQKSVCHVADTEHIPGTLDEHILKAVHHTDLMIYDSTYTDDTWGPKRGWGHSTWEQGIRLARAAGVKSLALYHHDHEHTDQVLEVIDEKVKREMPTAFMSRQGMVVEL